MTDSNAAFDQKDSDDSYNLVNLEEPEIFKPVLETKNSKNKTAGSFISLIVFAVIGYFLLKSNIKAVVIITTVIFIHELGHLLAMKFFNYTNLNIFFIPFFGGAATGRKTEVSQKQEAIILLSGPLPGIIFGIILFFAAQNSAYNPWLQGFSRIFIFLNILNLLPIYPLDGGRMLKIIFLSKSQFLAAIFLLVSIICITFYSISHQDYIFLLVGFMLLMSVINAAQKQTLIKTLKEDKTDLNTTYQQLNKEQYIHIRLRMVQLLTIYKKYDLFDFDIYSKQEERLSRDMEQILKPLPINDMKFTDKIIITIIWMACFIAPFALGLSIPFLK